MASSDVAVPPEATGLGLTKIGEAIRDGRIKSKLVDGRRLLDVPSVLKLVEMDNEAAYKPNAKRGHAALQSRSATAS